MRDRAVKTEEDLDSLLEFLHMEIRHCERSQSFEKEGLNRQCKRHTGDNSTPSAISLTMQSGHNNCTICHKSHDIAKCYQLMNTSFLERQELIACHSLSFKCLSPGHFARSCRQARSKCKNAHHQLLCEPKSRWWSSGQSRQGVD